MGTNYHWIPKELPLTRDQVDYLRSRPGEQRPGSARSGPWAAGDAMTLVYAKGNDIDTEER